MVHRNFEDIPGEVSPNILHAIRNSGKNHPTEIIREDPRPKIFFDWNHPVRVGFVQLRKK